MLAANLENNYPGWSPDFGAPRSDDIITIVAYSEIPEEEFNRNKRYYFCHEHIEREENKPPITIGSIPNQTFPASGGAGSSYWCNQGEDTKFSTDVSSLFEDPDDDDLTYEVTGEPSWLNASISGSTLSLDTRESAVRGDSTTITVTASDGKDDGDASLSFNVNIVAEKTPKPILSKNSISLSLAEVLPDQPTPIAQDSYSVTLSCQYRFPVNVKITDTTSEVLQIAPTNLTFNQTNWDVPQTVRVRTVGPVPEGDITFQEFDLPHTAITTTLEGKTVRESGDNLGITLRYERLEDDTEDDTEDETDDDMDDDMDNDTEDAIEDAIEKAKEGLSEKSEEKLREAIEKINKQEAEEQAKAKVELALEIAEDFVKGYGKDKAIEIAAGVIGTAVCGPACGVAAATGAKGVSNMIDIWQGGQAIIPLINSNEVNHNNEAFNRLAENLYIHHEALQNGNISLDQAFSGQSFSFPFSLSQASPEDQESSQGFNALLNANIDFSRFSDNSDTVLDIDGTTTNYGIGLTVIPNPEVPLITGLQLGYTRSNSDFEYLETVEGTYNLEMFSISPFIAWDATDSLTLWTTVGYGKPNTETTINSIVGLDLAPTEEASHSSSGDFFSFAGGANYRVWQSDLSALSLGLSGSTTSFLDNNFKEGRIAAQFSHNFPFDAGKLQTSADLALILSDSGPSATELSGQLNWLPNQGRLSGSTNARVLLFGGDRSEWGIGGSVILLPGERGEGLSIALHPSFGQTNSSLSNLHLDPFSFSDPTELALSTSPLTARFNAELAYGFPTGNHALLTPYIDASLAHSSNTYTTGLRYQLDSGLDLDLSASHRTRSSGNNDNRFFLQLRSDL